MGYLIEQELLSGLQHRRVRKEVVTLVTRVVVDRHDAAFNHPTKPVGMFYTKVQALKLQKKGMIVKEDAGRGYRRVVASPVPKKIIEGPVIVDLVQKNVVVIAAGGGGIPVSYHRNKLRGEAAVIDKDLAASLVARMIKADMLLIITSVPFVYLNFHQKDQKALRKIHLKDAKKYLRQGHFAEGSMAPKIKAAIDFLQHGGKKVVIRGITSNGTTIVR
ncbi:carbamate kinase [Candidatus Woesearchaeota archaeon]|nr:carbamate kinase [Candidatus Woesearchaeota archaeon]